MREYAQFKFTIDAGEVIKGWDHGFLCLCVVVCVCARGCVCVCACVGGCGCLHGTYSHTVRHLRLTPFLTFPPSKDARYSLSRLFHTCSFCLFPRHQGDEKGRETPAHHSSQVFLPCPPLSPSLFPPARPPPLCPFSATSLPHLFLVSESLLPDSLWRFPLLPFPPLCPFCTQTENTLIRGGIVLRVSLSSLSRLSVPFSLPIPLSNPSPPSLL